MTDLESLWFKKNPNKPFLHRSSLYIHTTSNWWSAYISKKMKSVLSTPFSSEIAKFRRSKKYLFRSLAPNSSTLLASIELESTRRLTRASKLLSATWTSSTVLCGAACTWPSLQGPQHSQPSWRLWSGLYRQKSAPRTTPLSYRSCGGPAARGASCDWLSAFACANKHQQYII